MIQVYKILENATDQWLPQEEMLRTAGRWDYKAAQGDF